MTCETLCQQYGNAAIVGSIIGGIAFNTIASYIAKHYPTNALAQLICKVLQAPHPNTVKQQTP